MWSGPCAAVGALWVAVVVGTSRAMRDAATAWARSIGGSVGAGVFARASAGGGPILALERVRAKASLEGTERLLKRRRVRVAPVRFLLDTILLFLALFAR